MKLYTMLQEVDIDEVMMKDRLEFGGENSFNTKKNGDEP